MFNFTNGSRLRRLTKKCLLIRNYRLDHTKTKFFTDLLDDLELSCLITLFIYFFFYILIYLCIYLNWLNDPTQSIITSNLCTSETKPYSNDLIELSTQINRELSKSNEKYFLCYRSLINILKLRTNKYNENYLDLCIYDTDLTPYDLKSNLQYLFGYSKMDSIFSDLTKRNSEISYEYNYFYGYFKLKYKNSEIFFYLYLTAPATRLEFESITRSGVVYTQFSQVVSKFYSSTNVTKSSSFAISLLNKLPVYMVNEMLFKVNLCNNYFFLPVDAFNSLMYFYPNIWSLNNRNSVKTQQFNDATCIF
ncbi:unnamed protein product [Brachionus calyciflorus]|uniref:Uncharacterized protein n=1 Tax=Brachionus calyciflorus TaxID=104777 RepID=A0A814HL92_9BILA|nr:unnamed protein product [Brachionus calyciflorus]